MKMPEQNTYRGRMGHTSALEFASMPFENNSSDSLSTNNFFYNIDIHSCKKLVHDAVLHMRNAIKILQPTGYYEIDRYSSVDKCLSSFGRKLLSVGMTAEELTNAWTAVFEEEAMNTSAKAFDVVVFFAKYYNTDHSGYYKPPWIGKRSFTYRFQNFLQNLYFAADSLLDAEDSLRVVNVHNPDMRSHILNFLADSEKPREKESKMDETEGY